MFCRDMDHSLREMGVGDLTVPKEMQRIAGAFYGRAKVYDAALDADDAAGLETAVARNVFGDTASSLGAQRLATYMQDASRRLEGQPDAAVLRAELAFPDPAIMAAQP